MVSGGNKMKNMWRGVIMAIMAMAYQRHGEKLKIMKWREKISVAA
jgi:hypothetical protein